MSYLFDPDNWRWLFSGNNLRFLFTGFWINIQIALVAMVLSLAFGLVLALLRLSKQRVVSVAAGIWVDVWRNLPLIFIILYFALAIPEPWRDAYQRSVPEWFPTAFQSPFFLAAVAGLTIYNSAVLAEIIRAGILSLPRGQTEASRALGLSYAQSMRHVILPQALRLMVPAMMGQLTTVIKDTSLVGTIGVFELLRQGRTIYTQYFNPVEVLLIVSTIYFVICFALSQMSRRLEAGRLPREAKRAIAKVELRDQAA